MIRVDTSNWKPFRVGDLFEVSYGKFIPKKDAVENGYPHVTTSADNNGISYNVKEPMFPAGCISVASDGSMGATFYQDAPYSSGNIVSNLVPHADVPMNRYIGLFIASLIKNESNKYSWNGFKFSVARVRETFIHLPVTDSGDPDWGYMESYMRRVLETEEVYAEHLASLTAEAVADGHRLDTSGWKPFRVGDLFKVVLPKGDIQPKKVEDGDIPLVSAGNVDNGIVAMISKQGDGISEIFSGDCITVNMFGVAFWQDAPFYAVSHGRVNVLIPKLALSKYIGLFLSASLNSVLSNNYDYATMCTAKRVSNEIIHLPVNESGEPDWAWMESYMAQQMLSAEDVANHLDAVWRD